MGADRTGVVIAVDGGCLDAEKKEKKSDCGVIQYRTLESRSQMQDSQSVRRPSQDASFCLLQYNKGKSSSEEVIAFCGCL